MKFKDAHEKATIGKKIITMSNRTFTKENGLNGLYYQAVFDDGEPITIHDLFFYSGWELAADKTVEVCCKGKTTKISIEKAKELDLI